MLDEVRALLPGEEVELVGELGGSRRSRVTRVRAGTRTLIVKEFVDSPGGWVRESSALTVLAGRVPVAGLVAAAEPTVVMADLGGGPSVADALLGTDPEAAAAAVESWAVAIARLHQGSYGLRTAFRERLGGRTDEAVIVPGLPEMARKIDQHCADLGISVPPGALDELRGLGHRLGPDSADGAAALTPADACPDNNVTTAGGLALIDFENAEWRHIAWDVAYLTVPWPTCWCSWRLPDQVAQRALAAYRAANPMPYVTSPAFRSDLAAAAVGWAFISATIFLPAAVQPPAPPRTGKPTPPRRAMVRHRLAAAAESAELPALAELAARMHAELSRRWGPVDLAYAPAFLRSPSPSGTPEGYGV